MMKKLLSTLGIFLILVCMITEAQADQDDPNGPEYNCTLVSCYHNGTCVNDPYTNQTKCICPRDGDTVYGGRYCQVKGTHLELPLIGIIGITAGCGSFIIIFLIIVIVGLVYRHKRDLATKLKGPNIMTMCEPAPPGYKQNGGMFGEFNPAFSSMARRSEMIHQPAFQPPGGDIAFGIRDTSREHHFARNSLHEPSDNMAVLPTSDLSNGVTRQQLHEEFSRNTRMNTRESQFVERNPDYHMFPGRNEPVVNGYIRNSRNLDRQQVPDRVSGGYPIRDESPTYIYRQSNRM